jgi:hypothetical protein
MVSKNLSVLSPCRSLLNPVDELPSVLAGDPTLSSHPSTVAGSPANTMSLLWLAPAHPTTKPVQQLTSVVIYVSLRNLVIVMA